MNNEKLKYYADNMEHIAHKDRMFLNNPVIMQGLGLAPIVVAATSMKNAVILSMAVLLLLMPTRVVAAFLSRFSYFRFRGLTYSLTAATLYIGVLYVINILYPSADVANVGLYLPLLVVDPIIIKRYERPQKERLSTAARKGFLTACGYIMIIMIMGGLREFLAYGTLYGIEVAKTPILPFIKLPFGGFILLGILIAVWRSGVNLFKKKINMGAKKTNA
ncbi:MAG: Rnf-Nqr domain containing protein [Oscillospiraceae bacterium]